MNTEWEYLYISPGEWCDISRDVETPGYIVTINHNEEVTTFKASSSIIMSMSTNEWANIIPVMEIYAEGENEDEVSRKIFERVKQLKEKLLKAVNGKEVINQYVLVRTEPSIFKANKRSEPKYWGFGDFAFVVHTMED